MESSCETCAYFVRHYVKIGEQYRRASGGHCFYPRVKLRFEDTPACDHYQVQEEQKAD